MMWSAPKIPASPHVDLQQNVCLSSSTFHAPFKEFPWYWGHQDECVGRSLDSLDSVPTVVAME